MALLTLEPSCQGILFSKAVHIDRIWRLCWVEIQKVHMFVIAPFWSILSKKASRYHLCGRLWSKGTNLLQDYFFRGSVRLHWLDFQKHGLSNCMAHRMKLASLRHARALNSIQRKLSFRKKDPARKYPRPASQSQSKSRRFALIQVCRHANWFRCWRRTHLNCRIRPASCKVAKEGITQTWNDPSNSTEANRNRRRLVSGMSTSKGRLQIACTAIVKLFNKLVGKPCKQ